MPWNTTLEGATTRHVAQTLVMDGEADDLARLVDRRLTQAGDKSHTEEEGLRSTKSLLSTSTPPSWAPAR